MDYKNSFSAPLLATDKDIEAFKKDWENKDLSARDLEVKYKCVNNILSRKAKQLGLSTSRKSKASKSADIEGIVRLLKTGTPEKKWAIRKLMDAGRCSFAGLRRAVREINKDQDILKQIYLAQDCKKNEPVIRPKPEAVKAASCNMDIQMGLYEESTPAVKVALIPLSRLQKKHNISPLEFKDMWTDPNVTRSDIKYKYKTTWFNVTKWAKFYKVPKRRWLKQTPRPVELIEHIKQGKPGQPWCRYELVNVYKGSLYMLNKELERINDDPRFLKEIFYAQQKNQKQQR